MAEKPPEPPGAIPLFAKLNNLFNRPHYQSIGKVAANWATLELLISSALWRLAKVDDKPGACLTAQIGNMPRLLDALVALIKLRDGSEGLLKRVREFRKDTPGLQEQRNRVVHDPWHVDPETGQIRRLEVSARQTLKFDYVPMDTAEINHVADLILEHTNRFEALITDVFAEVETLVETSRPPDHP